jgi:hypothetical protein
MLERCPTCGKTIGTLMETHPQKPGVVEILSGEKGDGHRIALTIAICVLATLAIVAAQVLLR